MNGKKAKALRRLLRGSMTPEQRGKTEVLFHPRLYTNRFNQPVLSFSAQYINVGLKSLMSAVKKWQR